MSSRRLQAAFHRRPADVEPGTLTTADLAKRWNVSYETLSRWRRIGRGPAWFRLSDRPNGSVRYRLSDVEAHEAKWGQLPASAPVAAKEELA